MKVILNRCFGDELPHPLGKSFPGHRPTAIGIKIAFLHGEVEELNREAPIQQSAGNFVRVTLFFGDSNVARESARGLPIFYVLHYLTFEIGWHVQFALPEYPCNPENQSVLFCCP